MFRLPWFVQTRPGRPGRPYRTRPGIEPLETRDLPTVSLALADVAELVPEKNVRVSFDPTSHQSEMSVAVNPLNPLNLVALVHRLVGPIDTLFAFSTFDGGLNWNTVLVDNSVDGINATFRFDPTVTFDGAGNVYLGYGINPVGQTRRLIVVKSTDGGLTYSQVGTVAVGGSLDKWIMGAGRDPFNPSQQNVYMAYRDSRAGVTSVWLGASYDGGQSFTVDTLVPEDAVAGRDFSSFGMPAVGPNGELYVIWDDFDRVPVFSEIKMSASYDGGRTFGATTLIGTTGVTRGQGSSGRYDLPAQPDRGVLAVPTIAVDNSAGPHRGRVYTAYTVVGQGGTRDNTDVIVRYSDDQGKTWSKPVVAHAPSQASQFLPWMDVDASSGAVGVVWLDTRNSPTNQLVEAHVSISVDGGQTFTETQLATAQSNQSRTNPQRSFNNYLEYIGLAFRDGTLHAIWPDNRDEVRDLELYTAAASPRSATGKSVLTVLGDDTAQPDDVIHLRRSDLNPAYIEVYVNGTLQFAGRAGSFDSIQVYGLTGDDTLLLDFSNGDPVPAGGLFFDGGTGTNAVSTVYDGDLLLARDSLTLSGVATILFVGVQVVSLTGGPSDNRFSVENFRGLSILNGAAGEDQLTLALVGGSTVVLEDDRFILAGPLQASGLSAGSRIFSVGGSLVLRGDVSFLVTGGLDIFVPLEGEPTSILKEGPGLLTLNDVSTITTTITQTSGTLSGVGILAGPLLVRGGARLRPGLGGSGVFFSTGSVEFEPGSFYSVQLNGASHNSLGVTGSVLLGNATLDLLLTFTPAVGDVFLLIDNDGTDPIPDTFSGLDEGDILQVGATRFQVSYVGGDGNDMVLTVVAGGSPGAGGGWWFVEPRRANLFQFLPEFSDASQKRRQPLAQ